MIGHVHMHDFVNGFPYAELFGLLQRDGYDGYLSSEIGKTEPTHKDYFLMYAQLFPRLERAGRGSGRKCFALSTALLPVRWRQLPTEV